jgi:hypothetical protein
LPLVPQSSAPPEEGESRPAWHWVGFGAVAIFIVWLPLAYVASAIGRKLVVGKIGGGEVALADLPRSTRLEVLALLAVPHALALVLAGLAGGFLVTRFGDGTTRRDAAFAGLAVGVLALGLTYAQVGLSLAVLVVPVLATASAAFGGFLGKKRA